MTPVRLNKARNIYQTRYIYSFELPVIDIKSGLELFPLYIQYYPDGTQYVCSIKSVFDKIYFYDNNSFINAVQKVLREELVIWNMTQDPQ